MRVLLLAAGSVVHTRRWAHGLAGAGVEVVCASQHGFGDEPWAPAVQRVELPHRGPAGYALNAAAVRRLFAERGCQLLNAHYATGYGTLATLAGVRPRLLSVWGSDVYDFPQASPLHRAGLRHVLGCADGIASTSHVMARQVRAVMGPRWRGEVAVTPFGVDAALFAPAAAPAPGAGTTRPLVVGTVKKLEPKYGIDTLIRAFALLADDAALRSALPAGLRLRLVGEGVQRPELEALARALGVADRVELPGAVPHGQVPAQLRTLDIYAAASRLDSESFGVAVIEASACGLPVVVTRVGGLPEVVREGETGLVVEREDPPALARALRSLALDEALRERLGRQGRAHVLRHYEWGASVRAMREVYRRLLAGEPLQAPALGEGA
jgi:glycosyltransferase involved in cell wall biosynthesis